MRPLKILPERKEKIKPGEAGHESPCKGAPPPTRRTRRRSRGGHGAWASPTGSPCLPLRDRRPHGPQRPGKAGVPSRHGGGQATPDTLPGAAAHQRRLAIDSGGPQGPEGGHGPFTPFPGPLTPMATRSKPVLRGWKRDWERPLGLHQGHADARGGERCLAMLNHTSCTPVSVGIVVNVGSIWGAKPSRAVNLKTRPGNMSSDPVFYW